MQVYSESESESVTVRSSSMKLAAVIVLAGVVAVVRAEYNTKFQNIDVDKILKNNRILSQYIKCIMEEGPCTSEGRELKRVLPEALTTGCEECSPQQKSTAEKVVKFLMKNRSNDFERLLAKYDPNGEYRDKYQGMFTYFEPQ